MRDRDPSGRPRNARPRDAYGRPLPRGARGVARVPDDYAPGAEEAVGEALGLLERERPFQAHEVLEARWKHGPPEERDLWQGLAQICVGLTHLQRGNRRGAAALLTRGAERITPYGRPYGVDVAATARRARELAAQAEDVPPEVAISRIREVIRPHRSS